MNIYHKSLQIKPFTSYFCVYFHKWCDLLTSVSGSSGHKCAARIYRLWGSNGIFMEFSVGFPQSKSPWSPRSLSTTTFNVDSLTSPNPTYPPGHSDPRSVWTKWIRDRMFFASQVTGVYDHGLSSWCLVGNGWECGLLGWLLLVIMDHSRKFMKIPY